MILAQADMSGLPASFIKSAIIFTLAAIVVMAFVVSALVACLQYYLDKRRGNKPTTIEPNPLPIQKIFPSATIKEVNDKHDEHGRRLDGHDTEIANIWKTVRDEDKEIRSEMSEKFDAISRALGRIEGKISGDHGD